MSHDIIVSVGLPQPPSTSYRAGCCLPARRAYCQRTRDCGAGWRTTGLLRLCGLQPASPNGGTPCPAGVWPRRSHRASRDIPFHLLDLEQKRELYHNAALLWWDAQPSSRTRAAGQEDYSSPEGFTYKAAAVESAEELGVQLSSQDFPTVKMAISRRVKLLQDRWDLLGPPGDGNKEASSTVGQDAQVVATPGEVPNNRIGRCGRKRKEPDAGGSDDKGYKGGESFEKYRLAMHEAQAAALARIKEDNVSIKQASKEVVQTMHDEGFTVALQQCSKACWSHSCQQLLPSLCQAWQPVTPCRPASATRRLTMS